MNTKELERRLVREGCSPFNFSIGYRGSDVFCLENQNGIWRVFYTERGQEGDTIYESTSEDEACEFFFNYVTKKIRHDHLVGFFISEQKAIDLESRLAQNEIPSHRDKIPYGGWSDPRHRVFVVAKDIFRARTLLGKVPLRDS
jgi:hypothetical protein